MLDCVFSLICEFLEFPEILQIRAVNKGTLTESKESTNITCHDVNIPSILNTFPKLKNISIGKLDDGEGKGRKLINITLSNFIDWFLLNDVVRLELAGVNITESSMVNASQIPQLRPPIVSLKLLHVNLPNHYLCGILLLMQNLKTLRIINCVSFGDSAANLLLAHLPSIREVHFEELFELQTLDYAHTSVKIHELHVRKCPRLSRVNPNHYLVKCSLRQTAINGENLGNLVKKSICLQEMVAEESRNIHSVTLQSSSLQRLSLARCMLLEYARGEFAALSNVNFTQCHRLMHVDLDAPQLQVLALSHLPSLNLLFVTSSTLAFLDLTGCLRLYNSIEAIKSSKSRSSPHSFAVSRNCMMSGGCHCRPPHHPLVHRSRSGHSIGSCTRSQSTSDSGTGHSFCSSDSDRKNGDTPVAEAAAFATANHHWRDYSKSYRRCFHHNQISLCCPKLKIKDSCFVFPCQPSEAARDSHSSHHHHTDKEHANNALLDGDRRMRRESL